ncbi:MAG: SDR family NAD(P)-dependent oxidoreductase [Verrucomicrobia bacterium]|jgi:short-subunit dehydrogenase|nr:SDR family NAD(P)-dependent oxidoreductase [Verrucomicrobiota bacterium]
MKSKVPAKSLRTLGYRSALITGTSSGLGLALARALAEEGLSVTGVGRSAPPTSPKGYNHLTTDLLKEKEVDQALTEISASPPDIWINNAGFGLLGGAWTPDDSAINRQLDLLFRVPVRLSRFFEAICRNRPEQPAYLIQISSLAVELPIPGMPYYNAAKSALSAFSESLLLDGALPFKLIDFRPGDFKTAFMEPDRAQNAQADSAYWKKLVDRHEQAPEPGKAAACLVRAMRRGHTGTLRSGSFFQSKIAPLGPRLLRQSWLHACIRRHYDWKLD